MCSSAFIVQESSAFRKKEIFRLNIQTAKQIEPRHVKSRKMSVNPARTQISLGIRPVWSEPSLCAQCVAKNPSFLHADSEDSDQTGRMPRLIWVFARRTLILLVLSCRGSIKDVTFCTESLAFDQMQHYLFVRMEIQNILDLLKHLRHTISLSVYKMKESEYFVTASKLCFIATGTE